MASSSKKLAAEAKSSGKRKRSEDDLEQANILVKRKLKDNLETKHMILKKHKVAVKKKTILVGRVPTHAGIADIIDFFKDVGQVVRVERIVKPWLKANTRIAFVKFASSNEAEKAAQKLENLQIFGQIIASYRPSRLKYCKDHIVWNKDYILGKEDETPPSFVENVLFVSNLSPQTKIFHIIDYFSYVGEVVSVRLIVNPEGRHVGYGFVEFDSADAAHNALELMNGEYLLDHMVFLDVAKLPPYRLLHQYNLAEKLCYEDYLRRAITKGRLDETSYEEEEEEGLDGTPSFVEAVAVRRKTISVGNLPCPTVIRDIIDLYKDVGQVVHVRLVTDCEGKQNGMGYIEFASAKEAEKAMKTKYLHGQKLYPYPAEEFPNLPRPKYCIDHNVWYEDQLGRENRLIDEELEEGFGETHDFSEEVALRKKTLFVYNLSPNVTTCQISAYYKNVGEVCRVRLVVNREGEHVGCGFVEFASAVEAKKALLYESRALNIHIISDVVEMSPYPIRPKYNLAEKLWRNEEYLLPVSLPIEGDYLEKPEVTKLFCVCIAGVIRHWEVSQDLDPFHSPQFPPSG
uniref:RRM domain-containing protein n=1 Tax=Brassica campestris TaxID=3711 RepID=A0A3P5YWZ8_BRACM|nr:unnamed protein product [Brassica rapa]